MVSRRYKSRARIFIILAIFVFATFPFAAKGAGPGVSLRVVESKLDDKTERGKLWLKSKPGSASTKTLAITNGTGSQQRVSLSVVPALMGDNGKLIEQKNPDINLEDLVSFSPQNFSLAPREIRQVAMTLRPKQNSELDFWDALVVVTARSTSQSKNSSGIVSLPIVFKVNYPAKIGIGNFDELSYLFSVEEVKPLTSPTFEKLLSISFGNQGNVPMIFMGQITLTDASFSTLRFGPYPFRSKTTNPNSIKEVNLLLPRDLSEGRYKVLVEVNNGKRSLQSVREVSLVFEKPMSTGEKILLVGIFLVAAVILYFSLRFLIRGSFLQSSLRMRMQKRKIEESGEALVENVLSDQKAFDGPSSGFEGNNILLTDAGQSERNSKSKASRNQASVVSKKNGRKSKQLQKKVRKKSQKN